MKVIDLLNKIANGEEVPEKIKYLGMEIFSFQHNCSEYINDYGTCFIKNISSKSLNDEVEIIEDTPKEDKRIEKLDYCEENTFMKQKENTYLLQKERILLDSNFKELGKKINEIIDKINGGK